MTRYPRLPLLAIETFPPPLLSPRRSLFFKALYRALPQLGDSDSPPQSRYACFSSVPRFCSNILADYRNTLRLSSFMPPPPPRGCSHFSQGKTFVGYLFHSPPFATLPPPIRIAFRHLSTSLDLFFTLAFLSVPQYNQKSCWIARLPPLSSNPLPYSIFPPPRLWGTVCIDSVFSL